LQDRPVTSTDQRSDTGPRNTLWTREHRITTIGLLIVVTLEAFEYLGVTTALPSIVAGLHGQRLYAWPITAFAAANAIGTVVAGRISDRRGPGGCLLVAVMSFGAGLVVSGTAGSMSVLLVGRIVQGFGAGADLVAISVLVAQVYPHRDRPAVSAALAAGWVVPSLVGPTLAGLVTQFFGWRWVFLGLVPILLIGLLLLVPVVRQLPAHQAADERAGGRGVLVAGVAAAAGVAALSATAQHLTAVTAPFALASLVITALALRRLLPAGTIRARPGLPSLVLSRGLLGGAYNTIDSFVPLAMTAVHGWTPATAGWPITAGGLSWAAASAWQSRHPDVPRSRLLWWGMLLVGISAGAMAVVAFGWAPGWLVVPVWILGGAGMGIGFPSIAVLLLNLSPKHERGFNSSASQLSEMVSTVVFVGLGGVLINVLASAAHPTGALVPLDLLLCLLVLFGVAVPARRITR
jgi:MFS family permease